ncbi:transmembrane protein [Cystoisospora suis]|uniref:Transmembrane protein n=1 Tax=Cystoisospora suis TaxID=483139 RepID=A0A2C6KIX3_9APIC|nr:transmembrane protein [Cystoisospora suis]
MTATSLFSSSFSFLPPLLTMPFSVLSRSFHIRNRRGGLSKFTSLLLSFILLSFLSFLSSPPPSSSPLLDSRNVSLSSSFSSSWKGMSLFPVYVHPVEGSLVAMVKRAANQGWRNGCRHFSALFSLPYEHLKAAFRKSSRHSQLEALCEEMDRILLMRDELGGSFTALPESIRRRYFDLIFEARDLFSRVLGRPVHIPSDVLDAAAALKSGSKSSFRKSEGERSGSSSTSPPSEGRDGHHSRSGSEMSGGSYPSSSPSSHEQQPSSSPSSASSPQETSSQHGGDANRKGKSGPVAEAATATARVYVPFREDAFEQEANERLRNMKNRHEGEIAAVVSEANEKLKQFQDEHKMFYDKKVSELRAQQSAELEQLHRDLQQEKGRSEEGKEHYNVISELLTETKAGLKKLDEDLQVISSNFFTIEQLLERTNEEKRALDRISESYTSSSSGTGGGSVNLLSSSSSSSSGSGATSGGSSSKQDLRTAFQALQHALNANEQSAQAAMIIKERTANGETITHQLDDLLNRCHTALSAAPTGPLFESQQRLYTDYWKSYEANVKDSNEKVISFSQEIDAKMLALTYVIEELHTKALSLLESTAAYLATDYSHIQSKAGELEQSYQEFLQASAHLEEQAAIAAQTALDDRLSFNQVFSELTHAFHDLQINLQRQEDSIKQLSSDIASLERTALVFMDGLHTLPQSVLNNREVLQQLNVQLMNDMLQFFSSYKQQVSQANTALRQRFQVTQDLMRKLDLLSKEIKSLADPTVFERLEAELVNLASELESKQQEYLEAENELKQSGAVVQTSKRTIRALEQKLSNERTATARAASMAGGGPGMGGTYGGGLTGATSSNQNAAIYEIESDLRVERAALREAESDKQDKQRRFNRAESEMNELKRDIETKRRTMANEQQKLARLQQLAQAVLGGPGSVTGSLAGGVRGSMAGGIGGSLQRLTAQGGLAGGSLAGGVRGTSLASLGGSLAGGVGRGTALGGLRSSLAGGWVS